MTLKLYGVDQDILLFCAFRYALGRRSYVVGTIADVLIRNWDEIHPHQRESYKKEIRKAIADDRAGMQMDIDTWQRILELGD